jgi:hypothetical protein
LLAFNTELTDYASTSRPLGRLTRRECQHQDHPIVKRLETGILFSSVSAATRPAKAMPGFTEPSSAAHREFVSLRGLGSAFQSHRDLRGWVFRRARRVFAVFVVPK